MSFNIKLLGSFFTGTSSFSVTNCLLIIALSLFCNKVSFLFFCVISSIFFSKLSKFLYLFINSAAVFMPIPGTPGILSEESPAKDWTSIT